MTSWTLNTPVILLIFNRPDTTRQVFEAIRQAQPPTLLVIADGPRPNRPGEAEQCAAARQIINSIDWNCDLLTHYSDQNLGCRRRVSSGLTWAFEKVEEAIILEDDCLPHPSFFRFCQELLEKYRHTPEIMAISGDNFQNQPRSPYSYYFSRYSHVWGWATWRRTWQLYDRDLQAWPHLKSSDWLQQKLQHPDLINYWKQTFDKAYQGFDTWDYSLLFTCWQHNGLTILPNVNLITNIGFGQDATHTKTPSPFANLPQQAISFPLAHPPHIRRHQLADAYSEAIMFSKVPLEQQQPSAPIAATSASHSCHICQSPSHPFAQHQLLNRYLVQYFQCSHCGFVQTEDPYWLEEAYSSAIANSDIGLVTRNLNFAKLTQQIIFKQFNPDGEFLDYGAGYGLFVRLMRDRGLNFYWHDKYAENLFAKGVEVESGESRQFELLTAFEVFEHFTNPQEEIPKLLAWSRNILFSTELLPPSHPKPGDWWYYAPEEGQHISLYTHKSLTILAQQNHLNLYSNGRSLHLLTEKQLTPAEVKSLFTLDSRLETLQKPSLLQHDYQHLLAQSMTSKKPETTPLKIVIDAVFFQIHQTGIARLWQSLLEEWSKTDFARNLVVLDRAHTAPKIANIRYLNTSKYDYNNTEADRQLLQNICDQEQAQLFISSYYTTPLSTPSIFMAYDLIPERFNYDFNKPMWREKARAAQQASGYICISQNTAQDLQAYYPQSHQKPIKIALCGNSPQFHPAPSSDIEAFKRQFNIRKPYFLLSGLRSKYKNPELFFQAFAQLPNKQDFEIVCTGGGSQLEAELQPYVQDTQIHLLYLTDDGLRNAYSGATALVFPSQYEGFGLPVLEAMACGCPVITSPTSSLPEVAGQAALYVQPNDLEGMLNALQNIQNPQLRQHLKNLGLQQSQTFSWGRMATDIRSFLIEMAHQESPTAQSTPMSTPPTTLDNPRQLRATVAQQWLNLPNDQLETHFTGQLGQLHKALWQSGLKNEPPTPDDQTTIAQLRQTLSQGLQAPGALQAFLCATLYGYPHQFNIQYHNAPIPNWMTELYLTYLFESPRLFKDLTEVDQYHQYFTDWTHYLQQKCLSQPNSPASQLLAKAYANLANLTPLCFSRRDSRRVQETRAALLEQYLEQQGAQLDYSFPPRPERRPIRFGILCLNTLPSAETFTTLPAFQHLDRSQFHIYLYTLQTTGHPYERHCQDCADQVRTLPADNLQAMVNQVRADDLDVLLIGTNITARSYPLTLLSLHRLARIQATGLSAPTTTGMRNLDIYIGGSLTATNPDQYSEQLVTVEGSGLCFQFPSDDDRPSISLDRANWGLAPDTTVFISGANFRKINPELRDSWAKLLAQVPNSILVLYPFGPNWGRHPQLERPFFQQMQQALVRHNVDPKRLLLIKTLPNRADVRLALQQADIYLDSFPYSGAASVLDPLRVGLPIVALEGSELRFRQSAALLRELGQPDLIAQTEADYRQLAAQLAHNPQQRQAKRQQIQAAMAQTPPFLDSRSFSAKIGTLLQQLVAGDLPTATDSSPLPPPEEQHPTSQAFINRTIGCCNIYYIDPSEQPIIEELRQLRRQLVDYWLTLPGDQLPLAYNSEIGKAFKALLKSDLRQEPLTPEEETYRQQLTEQGAGLVKPQALNALMGAMLYYPVEQMKVRDAQTRLPDWLYPDYAAVFEAPAPEPEPPAPVPTPSAAVGATAPQAFAPNFLQDLEAALNQYSADTSNADIILKLRNLRHQLILTLASQPLEAVAQQYRGEFGRVYKKLLRSGFQKQPLADIEVQTRAKLSEAWKNRHHQAVNAMMGLFLYFPPGTMKIQEPTTRLPNWLLPDYREVFEAALPADGVPKAVSSEQLPPPPSDTTTPSLPDEPVPSASFLNRLLGTVNLYQIDPNDATILAELRQIRRRFADHWLTIPQGELERIYYEDLGRGYRILLTSGIQKQPLTPEETEYRQQLTQKGAGLTEPQSLNALMGAMLYYPTDQLRVQDAATRLPSWLLPDYEAVFEGKAQQQPSVQPPSPEFGQQVATLIERLRQNPNDGAALVLLRQARQSLCQYWLSLPAEQLPGAYGGPMGEVQRQLMSCGLRGLPRTGAEQSLFEQLRGELSQGMSRPKSLQCFLAAMLLCAPDQLRLSSAHGLLPTWLVGDYERVFLVTG
ncbi:MAG: putative O-linked N-acetylglucosamine transferase, SPINDLY family [Phormidium sp. OSCR]|nr:MAG: putative O-linked N-acetylglucosamine transferase, SPINDLY family [Phormidium sp. OSCR]